ncbi:MAG: hypothetical protein ACQEWU_20470 [Bacillota bacterium]|uniref:hypothetical protein n=1 Tax=unclassified Virgibacillus TaxID=2620237 RepID=UPI000EF49E1E|nr:MULTISPECIES: hypothetical protein [unclassified Virgibacillus]MDY7046465.1 hypothetical protein [Virgibacillus sp. M23]
MKKKLLVKFGAPVLALSLIAACGIDDDQDPVEDEAPLDQQEEDNIDDNPADDNGGMNEENPDMENDGNDTDENNDNNMMDDENKDENGEGNQ